MSEERLKIVVTADNADAIANLNKLTKQLGEFERSLKTATDSKDVLKLSASIAETKAKMEVLNSSLNPIANGTRNLAAGSNQAAQALTNVGRVAQDLPFGFMGIQNNLNPLLESFQRLKAETGSGSAALRALGSSLMGAGGVGLALSIASSAFVIFQNGIMGFNKKTAEAKEKLDKFTEALNQNREAGAKDLSVMNAYVDAAKNTALSTDQRKTAVDKLIQLYPDYFKGLTVENALTTDLTQTTNSLTEAIYKRAAARAMEGDVAAKATDVFREQEKLEKVRLDIEKARADVANQKKQNTQIGGGGSLGGMSGGVVSGADISERNLASLLSQQDAILTSIDKKKLDIASTQLKINQLTADTIRLDAGTDKETAKKSEHLIKVKEIKVYEKDIENIVSSRNQLLAQQVDLINKLAQTEKQKALSESLRVNKYLDPSQKSGALADYDKQQAQREYDRINNQKYLVQLQQDFNLKLAEQQKLADSVGSAFAGLFNNIARSKNPFEALTNAVKQLVIDLAAAVAKMLVIRLIMSIINPVGAAASGIGAVMGSALAGVPKHAAGGITTGPSLGIVGEAGPEAIIPLDRLGGFVDRAAKMGAMTMGSHGGGGGGEFTLRGQDLVLAMQRSNYSLNLRR